MAFCKNCGTELYENEKFCRACGTPVDTTVDVGEKFKEMSSTTDSTALFDATDIAHNKALAMQSYLGILVLFPIFGGKHSPYARFHANQGLLLIIANVAYGITEALIIAFFNLIHPILGAVMGALLSLGALVFTAAAVLGIINAVRGKASTLPFIGKFKLIK